LWNCFHDPKEVRGALEHTLKQLNLQYLDLYLIHWPIGYPVSKELFPKNEAGEPLHTNFDLKDTWRAMEDMVNAGLTKSIGISNFNIEQVDYIVANAKIQPVTNQFEVHPYLLNKDLIKHCRSKNIVVTAYSPLGSPGRPWATAEDRFALKEPKLIAIAEKYKKSPGQVLVRYQVQIGNVVIPKSVTKDRIISNFSVFDFELSEQDIKDIEGFGFVDRVCKMTQDKHHPQYPFKSEV
jgi:aldehyde reductase